MTDRTSIIAEAQQIADALVTVAGVEAVVLGGSWARGLAHPDSDIDLGMYYRRDRPLDIAGLRALAVQLGDRGAEAHVTGPGEWGTWINGGAWLQIGGRKVDWLYRELGQVERAIEDAVAGRVTLHYQPGHPFAFGEHIYAGEVHICLPMHDPAGCIAALKQRTDPYPPALRRALLGTLWEAEFCVQIARTPASRGDSAYVAGCLFRGAMIVLQALFALNGEYWLNEKGALERAAWFPLAPEGLEQTVREVLGSSGTTPDALTASIERLHRLVEAVKRQV